MINLFFTFLKIGALTFGGGYAMLPLIQEEALLNAWLTESEILSFIAIAESTPGPIAINMATFIGASQYGFWGALLATLGVVLPSFIIILLIATIIKGLMKFSGVQAVLSSIRPVVSGLIFATGITVLLTVILNTNKIAGAFSFDWRAFVIFSLVTITSLIYKKIFKKGVSPIILIIFSAVLGIVLYGLLGA